MLVNSGQYLAIFRLRRKPAWYRGVRPSSGWHDWIIRGIYSKVAYSVEALILLMDIIAMIVLVQWSARQEKKTSAPASRNQMTLGAQVPPSVPTTPRGRN